MKPFKAMADAMGMDDETWLRHANPWSVWTRFIILPLMALAIWARIWLGWWSLALVVVLAVWTRYNPRAFSAPKSTKSWSSRAVMGERVWLARKVTPIPSHHAKAAIVFSSLASVGMPFMVYGLWVLDFWPSFIGVVLILVFKMWFLDRMVWLYNDMASEVPEYAKWLR
ncbi:MAG: DUF6653 family protein [Paracoccaceae bacterium]|jgi:hypothetical protein